MLAALVMKGSFSDLQQVPIRRSHVSKFSLLMFRQPNINDLLVPVFVRQRASDSVNNASQYAEDREGDTDGVSRHVIRRVFLQEREDCDDATDVAESNLPGTTD